MTRASRLVLPVMMFAAVPYCRPLDAQTASTVTQSPSIAVNLRMEKNRTSVQKEANAIVTIRNIGSRVFVETGEHNIYRLHVEGEAGEPPKTLWYQQLLAGSLATTLPAFPENIAPGESVKKTFILGAFYDFSAPGKYKVYVDFRDTSGAWIPTNTAPFEILGTSQK